MFARTLQTAFVLVLLLGFASAVPRGNGIETDYTTTTVVRTYDAVSNTVAETDTITRTIVVPALTFSTTTITIPTHHGH
ncbi:hypothetical protein CERSUDRAFT_96612 [Gelatoporia subvermispora B]|uniref:Uncharacterized protein n=1 Tax=Ceriporiopsis subvermispora (strain B) TaxID=914234 RepID=M2R9R1_CERS8|nr:hypothetical protein CERSUDRAFT_96612 [Gelatoporia subvermispora B]